MLEGMRAFGASAEDLRLAEVQLRDQVKAAELRVLPENWCAVRLFLRCSTQWRVTQGAGGDRLLGLEYPSVLAVAAVLDPSPLRPTTDRLLEQVQVMELAAIEAANK